MPVSKFQTQTKERLILLLKGTSFEENYRPDWLTNPETGRRLEIDLWLPDVNIGIEVQGAQHTRFIPGFHKDNNDFEKQKARDDYKREVCKQRGILLFEVYSLDDIDSFIEKAHEHRPEFATLLFQKNAAIKSLGFLAAELYRESRMRKHRGRMEGLTRQIQHICERFGIKPKDIQPDFTVSKIHTAFVFNSYVKLRRGKKLEDAVLLGIENGLAHCKWILKKADSGYGEGHFDVVTGEPVERGWVGWQLIIDTLPTT